MNLDHELIQAILYFMLYSFLGWIAQGIFVGFKKRHFVNTGFMYGPVVPIYGFGALLIVYVVDPLVHHWLAIFLLTFFLCSVLEYFTSWAMQKLFHRLWWNYSQRPFNLHGRVCLLNSTLYGLGGLVITYITQPPIHDLVARIPWPWQVGLAWMLLAAFLVDLAATLYHMAQVDGALRKIHQAVIAGRLHEVDDLQSILNTIDQDRHLRIFETSRLHEAMEHSLAQARAHLQQEQTRINSPAAH